MLPSACQNAMFPSLTDAVQHMVAKHMNEVDLKKAELLEAREKARQRSKNKDAKSEEDDEDRWSGDISSPRSVAQQLVLEFMGIYVSHVGLPQVIGRKKWFPDAKLARIIVGFHLRDVDMDKQPLWDSVH